MRCGDDGVCVCDHGGTFTNIVVTATLVVPVPFCRENALEVIRQYIMASTNDESKESTAASASESDATTLEDSKTAESFVNAGMRKEAGIHGFIQLNDWVIHWVSFVSTHNVFFADTPFHWIPF